MKSLDSIKRRINSIETTSKITNAMKLVATSKLKKQKDLYQVVANFSMEFYAIFSEIISSFKNFSFTEPKNKSSKNLYIVISSTLGLCGSYNINVCKKTIEELKANDELIVIGQRGTSYFSSRGYEKNIVKSYAFDDSHLDYLDTISIADFVNESYSSGKYESIKIVYTKFINSLSFEPKVISILPLDKTMFEQKEKKNILSPMTEFEPSKETIVKTILPVFVSSILYAAILESKVCENGSRRNAMDTATKNAKEIIDKLTLEFNRVRQENITQEINEIVAGANSNE